MANEGGTRGWWQFAKGVNVSNGNLLLILGSGSCVTCGGSGKSSVYPNPTERKVQGPILVYNSLGTAATDLGPKWKLPWHVSLAVDGIDVTIEDCDGTIRFFEGSGGDPPIFTANHEQDVLTYEDDSFYRLTRFNGDQWDFDTSLRLSTITARSGDTITIEYDGNDRIETVTDAIGRVTKFFYITYGSSITRLNEIRQVSPNSVGYQSTFLQYDSAGKLIAITNPLGETTRFEYDGSGRISDAIDGHGHITGYSYDGNKVARITDPASNLFEFTYDTNTTTLEDPLTFETVYTIDGNGRVTKITDPLGQETELTYDSTTWRVSIVYSPKLPKSGTPWSRHKTILTYGNTTETQHELKKREVKKITNSDSTGTLLAKEEWTHNAWHDVLTYKNPLDEIETYTYQLDGSSKSVGYLLTIVNEMSQTVLTNTYDDGELYRLIENENGVGKSTTYEYGDGLSPSYGIPNLITSPEGNETHQKVDIRGRISEVTDPSGNPVSMEYDELDRLVRVIYPDNTTSGSIYDCCHLVATYDQMGRGTQSEYDLLGRTVKTIDPNGAETSFEYNENSWLTAMIDPRGNGTTYEHDDAGKTTAINYPGGWIEGMAYLDNGQMSSLTNQKGMSSSTTNLEYDDLYYLKKKDFPSGTDTEYETNAIGSRTKMKDTSGEKRYTYDDANRLTKTVQGPVGFVENTDHNYKIEYQWNAASQLTQRKVTIRTLSAVQWDYTYTDDGLLDTLTNPDSEVTKFEYLDDGRLKKITILHGTGNSATREYFYLDTDDSHDFVAGKQKFLRKVLDKNHGGSIIISREYELDLAGNRLGVTDETGKYTRLVSDPALQLRTETKWASKASSTRNYQYGFAYDENGNRITQHKDGVLTNYSYGDSNELLSAGSATFGHDLFGSINSQTIGGNTTNYGYDFERHLTSVDYPGTSNDDSHQYDGDGVRMRSKLNGATDWTNFIHCPVTGELLAEYTLVSGTFSLTAVNTWGAGLISTNRGGTKRYFHFDGSGNTVALTNDTGTVTDSYEYSLFGVTESSSVTSVNPFRFKGSIGAYSDGAMGSSAANIFFESTSYSPELMVTMQGDWFLPPSARDSVSPWPKGFAFPCKKPSPGTFMPAKPGKACEPYMKMCKKGFILACNMYYVCMGAGKPGLLPSISGKGADCVRGCLLSVFKSSSLICDCAYAQHIECMKICKWDPPWPFYRWSWEVVCRYLMPGAPLPGGQVIAYPIR